MKTTFGNYIIITSLGELDVEGEKFVSISEQTPLAQELFGKKAGDDFSVQ